MTIVTVNGGGNTPQGYQLDECFVKSWSTSGDANDTSDSFIIIDYKPTESVKAGGGRPGDGAPGEDVMCQNNLRIGDDFIIVDYKPTVEADDNSFFIDWLAEDHQSNPNETVFPTETIEILHQGFDLGFDLLV
jgi:hypothetical protein